MLRSHFEQRLDINEYLCWRLENISVLLGGMNIEYYMLFNELHTLNKHRHLINSEHTFKKTHEEKNELDKMLERFDEFHESE